MNVRGGDTQYLSPHTGRHRRGAGTASWTPAVPPQAHSGRHLAAEDRLDPPSTGSLPLALRRTEPDAERGDASDYLASTGELPITRADLEPGPAVRRTKVTLTPPPRRDDDDDLRVYLAPTRDGLGTFDLGTVPASVTPPRSWRKAAWFATASSGGVVVALLFAGSFLVGKPDNARAIASWPGLQGGQPTMDGEQLAGLPPTLVGPTDTSAGPQSPSSASESGERTSVPGLSSSRAPGVSATIPDGSNPGTVVPPAPSTSKLPQKPPPTQAPYSATPTRYWWAPANQPQTLAAKSQSFLDKVTEDPASAHAMTTGDLADQGTEGLARKYADVAYFEVKHVEVRQYEGEGVTFCTVKAVQKDGSSTTEQRKLTFGDNAKIQDDGQ